MAETYKGTLLFKGGGKNRRRFLSYTSKKGKPMSEPIGPDKLAPSLRDSQEREVPVDFELDSSGRPFRVRAVGESWIEGSQVSTHEGRLRDRFHSGRREDGDFHNPYNFIPAPPRPKTGTDLDDSSADKVVGHDRYYSDHWTGKIRVKLNTESPLLIPDTSRVTIAKDHKTFEVQVDSEGNSYLAPTSIKGMLRAAYEAITNSRMGVFYKHEDRLAYRMAAKIGPVPALVEKRGSVLGFRIMRGDGVVQIGFAAKLPRYQDLKRFPRDVTDKGAESRRAALTYPDHRLPQHRDKVWVQVERSRCTLIEVRTDTPAPSGNWHAGWVCATGPNINRKKYERVFVESSRDTFVPITDQHKKLWRELIENYQETHTRDLDKRKYAKGGPIPPDAYLGDKPGETGWSRHVYEENCNGEDCKELLEGTLCYVELSQDGTGNEISAVIPVTISRRLYESSPDSLLHDSLRPPRNDNELSPADRVFGWVHQKGKGAYRGNLRIGAARCISHDPIARFSREGVPLAILGQPKPQQARFYVAASPHGEAQEDGISRERAGYWPHKALRGRKVYPHHAGLPDGYWVDPETDRTQKSDSGFFQEYRRPHKAIIENGVARLDSASAGFDAGPDEQRDDQNRSVSSWIKSGAEFVFDISVTNLSRVELGALLWLLDLPPDHFHRLGGGKPLGFGSVSLKIDWEQTDLRHGKSIRKRYVTLDPVANDEPMAAQRCIDSFKNAVARVYGSGEFERVPFIAAFRRYAQGFNKPVHYPRALQPGQGHNSTIPPHPEGKAFEWFVANERTGREGGPKLSLPDIASDSGLPILKK